jgi:hypothetical protein
MVSGLLGHAPTVLDVQVLKQLEDKTTTLSQNSRKQLLRNAGPLSQESRNLSYTAARTQIFKYHISWPIRHTCFPKKCDLNSNW